MEAVAEQVDAGLPEREFSSLPLDNEGSAPRGGDAGHIWTRISSGGSRASA